MIPTSPDVRQLVGEWAEQVDNRSLLHEKFALPKGWDVADDRRLDNAGRWSVLRIVTRGKDLLNRDATNSRGQAERLADKNPGKAKRLLQDAAVAERMAKIAQPDPKLAQVANDNASRFLGDLRKSYAGMVITFEATLGARLMVNLAGGVVENAGIALDRCFGLPFIPGSAVKGITRAQALWEIKEAKPDYTPRLLRLAMLLFGYGVIDIKGKGDFAWAGSAAEAKSVSDKIGSADFKGCGCFLPAYPITPPELLVDMVNPHYPEFYRGRRAKATDDESPVPNYFPAVKEGSTFAFAVLLNRSVPDGLGLTASDLAQQAEKWLQHAVTRKGAGAKTAAGYGWFELGRRQPQQEVGAYDGPTLTGPIAPGATPASPADTFIARWRGRLTTKDNFPVALPELVLITDDTELKRAFDTVIPENDRRRNRKNNPYWQSFTSGGHGDAGKRILARLGFKLV